MSFLVVLCEGFTEQDFVAQVLGPHLEAFGVRCHPILLGKRIKRDHAEAPGGVLKWDPVYRHIRAALRQYSSAQSFVTTMLDFYAFPRDFPGYEQYTGEPDPAKRVDMFEKGMYRVVGDPRFVPYVQLHEFEALVLCCPDEVAAEFEKPESADVAAKLTQEMAGLDPEAVDETRDGAPSKRIARAAPGYRKRVMGPRIVGRIGLGQIRARCAHFGWWLSRLEKLESQAT